jgi:hypothetical protein
VKTQRRGKILRANWAFPEANQALSSTRMIQDVSYLQERTKALTDSAASSPTAPLEDLVRSKSTPRRQMSSAINGLLRRKNDSASTSATSLHDIPNEQQATPEKDTSAIDDEDDALPATIVQPSMEDDTQQTAPNGTSNGKAGTASQQLTLPTESQPDTTGTPVINTENSTDQAETAADQEGAKSAEEIDVK